MKVLVVEDNTEKLRRVLGAIASGGCATGDVDIARDTHQAKIQLMEAQYDLMVLDLVLPSHSAERPRPNGGVELLRELQERDRFKMPREVIGLTAYGDIKDEAAEMFSQYMWSIIVYDPKSDFWFQQIERKISHLLLADRSVSPLGFQCHACIVTAMSFELDAVLRIPWTWEQFERSSDVALYWKGQLTTRKRSEIVYAASAPRIGIAATAVLASKMIEAFRPRFIVMTGITAGIAGRCDLGDVIVADPSWDWESGKYSREEGISRFEPAPHQIALNSSVRVSIERQIKEAGLLDEIKHRWPGEAPSSSLKLLIGPVACGGAVLADPTKLTTIESQHRKVLAVEMESYGLYAAASEARVPQPTAVALKGVSDFADEAKDDAFQKYAAYTSAEVLRSLFERFL
jgi:nucleoside phosphorylase/CheY-like chemotaxis protein